MLVIGIDPGTHQSAFVAYSPDGRRVLNKGIEINERVLRAIYGLVQGGDTHGVIEDMVPYATGYSTKETIFWVGRFWEAFSQTGIYAHRIVRDKVVMHLCGRLWVTHVDEDGKKHQKKLGDKHVKQALLTRFEASGGGKIPQVGIKAKKGPLFGMKSHMWPALAVAITFSEKEQK